MIALTTPTGTIGCRVLSLLLEQAGSTPIRVIARNPDKLPKDCRSRIEVIQGSLEDLTTLTAAFRGATSLFWCQPDASQADDYSGAYNALAQTGARAIRECEVERVIAISAAGEPEETSAGPISALHQMESILMGNTRASFRCLRCGSFFENLLWQWDRIQTQNHFTYPAIGSIPGPHVAASDIARTAAGLLLQPDWSGNMSIPLLGPEDLSYDEIASLLTRALGLPVRFESADAMGFIAEMRDLGYSAAAAQALVEMFHLLSSGYSPPPNADRSLTSTTLEEWLMQVRMDTPGY